MDLKNGSREDLIAIILAQRDLLTRLEQVVARQAGQIAALDATIKRLTERLGERAAARPDDDEADGGASPAPRGMPGLKPGAAPARPPAPRTRRGRGYARRRMAPTRRVEHAVAACPHCQTPLAGGTVVHRREVLDLPAAPVEVVEHVWLERRCPGCRRPARPPVDLGGVVVGRSRLGVRLVSLLATLREVGRLPVRGIQELLRTLYGLSLSQGGLHRALGQVVARGQGLLAEIRAAIRASPVAHADESGWREAGRNGYVWTFSTPTERYFVRRGRAGSVVDEVLGEVFGGVLVADFYAAYDHYPGLKQRCWAHLLRAIRDLERQHPRDAGLRGWADGVREVYERATAACPLPAHRRAHQRAHEQDLLARCRPYLTDEAAPHAVLCRRIEKYLGELFVFVADPRVPPTNNAAERSLRPVVIARKISGGTRSEAGSVTKMALASLFGTWRARGLDPFAACLDLLSSPQA